MKRIVCFVTFLVERHDGSLELGPDRTDTDSQRWYSSQYRCSTDPYIDFFTGRKNSSPDSVLSGGTESSPFWLVAT